MISEPSTLLTDYALGSLAAWLAYRLSRVARESDQRSIRWWALAFWATAAGSFAGGTYHGFTAILSTRTAAAIWTLTTIAIGAAACLLLSGALWAAFGAAVRRRLMLAVWAQFVLYVAWMLRHDDFFYVIVEYGSAMLLLLLVAVARRAIRRTPASLWIVAGVAGTVAAAAVQQSGVDLHRHFNHNDAMHLVQMVAVGLLYQAGKRLTDHG